MKTYQTTIEKPILKISYDSSCESPRSRSNLGYFVTSERNYSSPDDEERIQEIIKETGEIANNVDNHEDKVKKEIEESGEKVLFISPVTKYEHSGVSYSLGAWSWRDYSVCGFYIVTDKTQKGLGIDEKDFEKVIESEIDYYTKRANGEIYGFRLYDQDGEIIESCSGLYSIDEIKEYLPKERENEDLDKYFVE